jgi:hypothetical protein
VDDNEVKIHFTEDELDEIKSASRPDVPSISDEVADYLEQINTKVMVNFHTNKNLCLLLIDSIFPVEFERSERFH